MTAVARLLVKDARLLVRSPGMAAALVLYPLLVGLLIALTVDVSERKPDLGVVNLDTSGRTVLVGSERLGIEDYLERLSDDVEVTTLEPGQADGALRDGRVSAVLTIPEDFVADLQSGGVRSPTLQLTTSRRDAVTSEAITRRLESSVFNLNQRLSSAYVSQVSALVDTLINGGRIDVFGRGGSALGLITTRRTLDRIQLALRDLNQDPLADSLDPLALFVDQTTRNLRTAGDVAEAIRNPIALQVDAGPTGRAPLSAFGVAAALVLALGLVGVMMAAAGLSAEREERTLQRLARGLVPPAGLATGKALFAAAVCAAVGVVLLVTVSLATSLTVGRWPLWAATLVLSGLAFAGFGAAIGAAARDTRTALLAALMAALPLAFIGLLPLHGLADALVQVVPFTPAFDAYRTLLGEPDVPGDLALTLLQLLALAVAYTAAATWAVRRSAAE